MLPKLVQRQLALFALVSLLAMSLLGVRYLEIPEGFGIGRFDVTVPLSHASGLYPNAPVTYRGVQIGKVSDVSLTSAGPSRRSAWRTARPCRRQPASRFATAR